MGLVVYPVFDRSVGTPERQTTGELQVDRSGRLTRHPSLPVFLSRATTKDFSWLSHWMKRRSPSSAGELPVP